MNKQADNISRLIWGAAAGAVAVIPMTLVMEEWFLHLPAAEQYPLPPAEITGELIEASGLTEKLTPEDGKQLTLLLHTGYGAACGAIYSLITNPEQQASFQKANQFALLVWAFSYLGLLPQAALLRSAIYHPFSRNMLMIGAHLIWGTALAACCRPAQVVYTQAKNITTNAILSR